ncbi:MAG: DEAD/DEAH box helicase [Desulfobacterium sp.]
MSSSVLLQLPNTFRAFYGAFPGLHTVQEEAIAPILAGRDLVIQAATGSGKSEAVLAPCLERIIQSGRQQAVLYIIPTRALAMDLKRRFESVITERLDLNLAIRTGDIKRTGGKRPDIMFTTPESLDVMLGSTNADLKAFLFRVGIVIVDEVHPLLHQYRGRHLVHLFTRLERKTGKPLQKIAMSATIARVDAVMKFLNFRDNAASIITHVGRKIIARLIHLRQEDADIPALLNDLYHTWNYRKILIFANSRAACDRLSGIVKTRGIFKDVSELHYSNLKPLERKNAEDRFRKRPHALCIATSTLELGIDVGDVDAVLLFQPPGSVSAFLQRIGRANRRSTEVNFWGLCSGERAGEQVVRFLALLELGRRGDIESPAPKHLPSVLSQQVISCLYEKKEISLPSLQALFPHEQTLLPDIFASLEKKSWLKKTGMGGLNRGGWQYRNHLLEYKIWGNFPEAEVEYVLEVGDKAVADIPKSVVSQMDMGDRIYLSGRRLKILKINDTEPRKVLARPCVRVDDKQLVWLGMGAHVSFEVAQAMGHILKGTDFKSVPSDAGLFTRTKKLFQAQIKQGERRVVLKNGMDVIPGRKGRFHYRTFLGSAGNLVLEWSIREQLSGDEVEITSHETGVECSHWICFEKIPLPVKREAFHIWVKKHFKVLQNLVPLSIFWKTLPLDLMVAEITDFLFDSRVAQAFAHYLGSTSDIVSGDMADLDPVLPPAEIKESAVLDIDPGPSLLESSRIKARDWPLTLSATLDRNRPLTLSATLISDYFFHAQCQRRFCFKLLGLMPPVQEIDELKRLARNQGICHEKAVMDELRGQGVKLLGMESNGSETLRFAASMEGLQKAIHSLISCDTMGPESVWISQCFLKVDELIPGKRSMGGVGVPDLLRLSRETVLPTLESHRGQQYHGNVDPASGDWSENAPGLQNDLDSTISEPGNTRDDEKSKGGYCRNHGPFRIVIGVGDIKNSRTPGYHHKWQVAFYARLLEEIIHEYGLPARVSPQGFLITPPWDTPTEVADESESGLDTSLPSHGTRGSCPGQDFSRGKFKYEIHEFDLGSYLAAFPMLFQTFLSILSSPPMEVAHRLQSHCVSCDGFGFCHDTALENEEIQFLPGLTPGELMKLRQAGCTTLEKTHAILEKISTESGDHASDTIMDFTPQQQKKLMGWCDAFLKNHIVLHEKRTRLFPRDISRACLIHVEKEPLTGLPWVLGWQVISPGADRPMESHVWTMETKEERRAVWQTFSQGISWNKGGQGGHGTHLFHFGAGTPQLLGQWGIAQGEKECPFLWQTQPSPWTDLKQVFKSHFYMPAPGVISLYTLAHVLGMTPDITPPPTLFHHHHGHKMTVADMASRVKNQLSIMADLYGLATRHLDSQWIPDWENQSHTDERLKPYLTFIKEERRLKEDNILMLQEQPLEERMLRFRALGYLRFDKTRLGPEGRFLSIFKTSDKTQPAKFRKGDFLKLVPHGMADIQGGFPVIVDEYDLDAGEVALLSRSGKLNVNKSLWYSLEEDISDWNQAKLSHAATALFENHTHEMQQQFLAGNGGEKRSKASLAWIETWLEQYPHGLNPSQQRALTLPFTYNTSMIQGPPGTGKTHLLGWILIALILQAHDAGKPLRIGVSALTHQAIDSVLKKVVGLVNEYLPGAFPGQCVKWGQARPTESTTDDEQLIGQTHNKGKDGQFMEVEFSMDAQGLPGRSWLILGATGYGFYNLFNSKNKGFPRALDWVVFDEASQVPLPQALLGLMYGRGHFLFLGDVNQLPPIVLGDYTAHETQRNWKNGSENFTGAIHTPGNESEGGPATSSGGPRLDQSILANFSHHYPVSHQVTLDTTYRMNREICVFPAKTWYENALHPAPDRARARLCLDNFPPGQSDHTHMGLPLDVDDSPPGGAVHGRVHEAPRAFEINGKTIFREAFLDNILDPEKPVVMVLTDHHGCSQKSDMEAELMVALAHRLMHVYNIPAHDMALISPHRAQNNAILKRLGAQLARGRDGMFPGGTPCLPLVDTVERVQGAERDVIFFGMTSSDPDHLNSEFLNSPHRLNVAMTRARTKLIVIGSQAFFSMIPDSETMLIKNSCFKRLMAHCETQDAVFYFSHEMNMGN